MIAAPIERVLVRRCCGFQEVDKGGYFRGKMLGLGIKGTHAFRRVRDVRKNRFELSASELGLDGMTRDPDDADPIATLLEQIVGQVCCEELHAKLRIASNEVGNQRRENPTGISGRRLNTE